MDCISIVEAKSSPRDLAAGALRWLEVRGLEIDHRRLRKLAGGQDDTWWVSRDGEVAGPMRLREVFELLVEGRSPVDVTPASADAVEEPEWITLTYSPLWPRRWVGVMWPGAFWGGCFAVAWAIARLLVPSPWPAVIFVLGVAMLVARTAWVREHVAPGVMRLGGALARRRHHLPWFAANGAKLLVCVFLLAVGLGILQRNGVTREDLLARGARAWAVLIDSTDTSTDTSPGPATGLAPATSPTAGVAAKLPAPEAEVRIGEAETITAALPSEEAQSAKDPVESEGEKAAPVPDPLQELAANPGRWPKTVRLTQAVTFSAVVDGKVIGAFKAPAGSAVALLSIRGEEATVEFQRSHQVVPVATTDLAEQARALAAVEPPPVAAPTPAPVTEPTPRQLPPEMANRPGLRLKPEVEEEAPDEAMLPEEDAYAIAPDPVMPESVSKPQPGLLGQTTAKEGMFLLPGSLYGNAKIKVHYRIPLDASGRPGPRAGNLVFYAPYISEKGFFKRAYHLEIGDRLGFSLFTFEIRTAMADVTDRERCYYYPESGWHEQVFAAREKLIADFHLPRRKLLVAGDSGGANMAQMLALHHPEEIQAVAISGGGRYDLPTAPSPVAWLLINTRGDPRAGESERLGQALRGLGAPVLVAQTPPDWTTADSRSNFHHTANRLALSLIEEFLAGAAALRDPRGNLPPAERWPFVADAGKPGRIEPVAQAGEVPAEDRRPLPTARFAELWKRLPSEPEAVPLPGLPEPVGVVIRRPETTPRGVIIFSGTPGNDWAADVLDNVDYLAEQGYVAISSGNVQDAAEGLAEQTALWQWVSEQEEFARQPIFLAGYSLAGQTFLRMAGGDPGSRVRGVAIIDSEPQWPLSPAELREPVSKLNCPLVIVTGVSPADDSNSTTQGKSVIEMAKAARKNAELITFPQDDRPGARWFAGLSRVVAQFDAIGRNAETPLGGMASAER